MGEQIVWAEDVAHLWEFGDPQYLAGLQESAGLSGIPPYVLRAAISGMDLYSERQGKEACGMMVRWKGNTGPKEMAVWSWKLLPNMVQGERARHEFEMNERGVFMILRDLEGLVEGEVVALLHSHPFAQPGGVGWGGPSPVDLENRRIAEEEGRLEECPIPDSLLWLPKAGRAGVLCGYNGEGTQWQVEL